MGDQILTLEAEPTFTTSVEIPRPGKAGVKVEFTFKFLPLQSYYEQMAESHLQKEPAEICLARIVVGWDEKRIAAPFSMDSMKKLLISHPRALEAIFTAYRAELYGDLPRKN